MLISMRVNYLFIYLCTYSLFINIKWSTKTTEFSQLFSDKNSSCNRKYITYSRVTAYCLFLLPKCPITKRLNQTKTNGNNIPYYWQVDKIRINKKKCRRKQKKNILCTTNTLINKLLTCIVPILPFYLFLLICIFDACLFNFV